MNLFSILSLFTMVCCVASSVAGIVIAPMVQKKWTSYYDSFLIDSNISQVLAPDEQTNFVHSLGYDCFDTYYVSSITLFSIGILIILSTIYIVMSSSIKCSICIVVIMIIAIFLITVPVFSLDIRDSLPDYEINSSTWFIYNTINGAHDISQWAVDANKSCTFDPDGDDNKDIDYLLCITEQMSLPTQQCKDLIGAVMLSSVSIYIIYTAIIFFREKKKIVDGSNFDTCGFFVVLLKCKSLFWIYFTIQIIALLFIIVSLSLYAYVTCSCPLILKESDTKYEELSIFKIDDIFFSSTSSASIILIAILVSTIVLCLFCDRILPNMCSSPFKVNLLAQVSFVSKLVLFLDLIMIGLDNFPPLLMPGDRDDYTEPLYDIFKFMSNVSTQESWINIAKDCNTSYVTNDTLIDNDDPAFHECVSDSLFPYEILFANGIIALIAAVLCLQGIAFYTIVIIAISYKHPVLVQFVMHFRVRIIVDQQTVEKCTDAPMKEHTDALTTDYTDALTINLTTYNIYQQSVLVYTDK